MENIKIINASEGNLKKISLEIPKNKLVVFTGVSGSGKSTLLIDVLFNECQRKYLEAMSMQGIHKPHVERISGASPAIIISQTDNNKNPRSTVGTLTDVYTDLRMIYEKLGIRICPHCKESICSADCKEETEKTDDGFFVYMYCSKCGKRMKKLTRTDFSFNTKEGACPSCEGLGNINTISKKNVIDENLSLEDGAVRYWEKQYNTYQISVLYATYDYYGIPKPINLPIKNFDLAQTEILFNGFSCDFVKETFPDMKPPKNVSDGRFEGVYPILQRRFVDNKGNLEKFGEYFETVECPECNGERLCQTSRSVTVTGMRLPDISNYSLEKTLSWINNLQKTLPESHLHLVDSYLTDMETKLRRFVNVGLGYLSLDRQVITLSGGELQRIRLAAVLDSDLTGVIYILDEPTVGLHYKDTFGLVGVLKKLRDLGNTVLVIEHDTDVMEAADYIIDVGPGAGKHGGEIIGSGNLQELKEQKTSVTGRYLNTHHEKKTSFRTPTGKIQIKNANKFNLKNIDADIPTGCLTSVTGPSGSGKSTLIFEVLVKNTKNIAGLEQFDKIITVEQSPISRTKRSNIATYSEVYTEIRNIFSKTEDSKNLNLSAKDFSFNTPGGRCENCQGLGYVESNMLFFSNIESICPECGGKRFSNKVLNVKYKGMSINDVLKLSVEEALEIFGENSKVIKILKLLQEVGLGYLELGQTLTTLSGGEAQRLKLATELTKNSSGKKVLYLMDEPTTGLHPLDVENFLKLLDNILDAGNTVVVVEHNKQIIESSDWIIDLGPQGGEKGGNIMFSGSPENN